VRCLARPLRIHNVTTYEARQEGREELRSGTAALIAEFADSVPAGTVIRYVARAREELLRAGVRHGLAIATEAAARRQLRDLTDARAQR
jgi:hypothetical protein